jgi:hypothetical protein
MLIASNSNVVCSQARSGMSYIGLSKILRPNKNVRFQKSKITSAIIGR